VHLRAPIGFVRAVGILPFFGFVIFVLGAVTTSLLSPVLWILCVVLAITGSEAMLGPYGGAVEATSYLSLIVGNGLLTLLAMAAPLKRRWLHLAPYGASVFLYWLLISVAAYKAMWQLVRAPFFWEKTEHGMARQLHPRTHWRIAVARLAPIIAVLACFAAQIAAANPWLKDKGALELISSVTVTKESAGLKTGGANATSGLHLEYGADARATVIVDGDIQRQVTPGGTVSNFDNGWVGVRTVLSRSDYSILSAEFDGGLSGIRRSAATSDMGLDGRAEARLMFGQGFDLISRHFFAGMETGWRWRGGAPADELLFDFGAGVEPWEGGLLMLQSFSIASIGEARGAYRRYELSKLQLSIAQRLNARIWLQAGFVDAIAGVDRGEAGAVLGVWWRF
jgi:hypothetical protein